MANIKNAERKSWNFGHFGTRHDGEKWNLVRIKDEFDGTLLDYQPVVASNKSATPLVALAREMSTREKRRIKLRRLRAQVDKLMAEVHDLEAAEAQANAEDVNPAVDITPEEAKAVLEALDSGTIRGDDVVAAPLSGKALKARAKELGIKGRGKMTADELRAAVAAA